MTTTTMLYENLLTLITDELKIKREIFPDILMYKTRDNKTFVKRIEADCNRDAYKQAIKLLSNVANQPDELLFGFDRVDEGCFTFIYFRGNLMTELNVGVIYYDADMGNINKVIDWENKKWRRKITQEWADSDGLFSS